MNETHLWFCGICDETINKKNKSEHINSKTHVHKQEFGTVFREYEFIRPQIDEVIYIFIDISKDCSDNHFHSSEFRCVYDIEFTNVENIEEFVLTITLQYMKFKSQF